MLISITSIVAINGGEEVTVTLAIQNDSDQGAQCQKQSFVISSKQYLILGLCKGECSTEVYDSVEQAAETWSATKKGIFLLGYGSCSKKSLRSKLLSKGFGKDAASAAVSELVSMGLLNEKKDASHEAQKCADKLWGKQRIASALYEKGYSAEAVEYALVTLQDSNVSFVQNCRRLIEKRYGSLPSDKAQRQKAVAALMRYGYSISEIKEASI